jgi:hypothetical protein
MIRALLAATAAELAAAALVHGHRRRFPWLITKADCHPLLDPELVAAHAARSYDPELGWCRRPGETATEITETGPTRYSVDAAGRRTNPGFEDQRSAPIACFGDSFTFCRLVDDDHTWPHHLSRLTGVNVANYGVGNYGLDQALLRLERELPGLDADLVVMGVVPETIARIHSMWKHYFEYGNALAFKPRFQLTPDGLVLHPSVIVCPQDFGNYSLHLPHVQSLDPFYQRKFRRDLLAFPYLPRLLWRGRRHLPILFHLSLGALRGRRDHGFRKAFAVVTRENRRLASRLYQEAGARALLTALIERFADTCTAAGKQAALVILPQPGDLTQVPAVHENFFAALAPILPVIDLTADFRDHPDPAGLYAYGKLGPHPSDHGNRLIAEVLAQRLPAVYSAGAAHGHRDPAGHPWPAGPRIEPGGTR